MQWLFIILVYWSVRRKEKGGLALGDEIRGRLWILEHKILFSQREQNSDKKKQWVHTVLY